MPTEIPDPPKDIIGLLAMMSQTDRPTIDKMIANALEADPRLTPDSAPLQVAAGFAVGAALGAAALIPSAMDDDDADEDVIAMLTDVISANALLAIALSLLPRAQPKAGTVTHFDSTDPPTSGTASTPGFSA